MTGNAVKRASITGIAVAIAAFVTSAVVGIDIAARPATANVLTLLHVGSPLVSGLHIGSGFSPVAACLIAAVLFLSGASSGLHGLASSAVAACSYGCHRRCGRPPRPPRV